MMLNKKSSRMSAWKALYVIPLVGISLAATAETKVDYRYEDQQPVTVADTLSDKYSENWSKLEIESAKSASSKEKSPFTQKNLTEGRFIVDKANNAFTLHYFDADGKELQVHYTGVDFNQNIYMLNGTVVAHEIMLEAAKEDPEAVVIVAYLDGNNRVSAAVTNSGRYLTGTHSFKKVQDAPVIMIRNKEGNTSKAQASDVLFIVNGEKMPKDFNLNSIDPQTVISMEVLKTEKALEEYGTDKGVIVITTDPSKANEKKPTAEKKEPVPFQHLGQQPTFNGGNANEFSKWVAENMKYPEKCRQSKIQGRVTLQFVITETGEVTDVRVLRGVNEELDKEALRVVSASPRWTPGKDKDGNIVPVSFTFPVLFQLSAVK